MMTQRRITRSRSTQAQLRRGNSVWAGLWVYLILLCLLPLSAFAQPGGRAIDPAAHWDFENGSALGKDSTSQGRDGQVFGGAEQTAGRHAEEKALALDGTGYVAIDHLGADLNLVSEVTVEAWVKVDAHDTNIFRLRQPVALGSDRFQVANYTDGAGWESLVADPAPPLGRWYHLVGVFDHGEMRLYIDGERNATLTLPFQQTSGTSYAQWALGGRVPGGSTPADQLFVGAMDDVKVYFKALDDAAVKLASNRRPMAADDSSLTGIGECVDIDVLTNDLDPDGDPLALASPAIVQAPSQGTANAIDERTVKYCPFNETLGSDEFIYRVEDGRGGSATAKVTIDVGVDSFADQERTLQVMEVGSGWQRLRVRDPETEAMVQDEVLAVWRHGIDQAPLTKAQKDELVEDFGPELPQGPSGSDDIIDNDVILIDLTALAEVEQSLQGMSVSTSTGLPTKGCFGWNDKEKTEHYSFNEWGYSRDFTLTDHINGNFSVHLPFQGQATAVVRYRIKKAACIPYKFRFKDFRAFGDVSINGDSNLGAEVTLNGHWAKEWRLAEPKLGEIKFSIGPVPVRIKFTLPIDVGVELNAQVTGSVGVTSDFGAEGTFDYTCTKDNCTGTSNLTRNFDSDQLTGSLEAQIDAKAYAKVQVKGALYHDSILYAQAGLKPYVEAELWGYYGNACGDGDGDGHNETVRALVVGVDAGYDIVYGWGGWIPDRTRTSTGPRYYLGWWDLLGEGGSDALSPMLLGPETVDRHEVTDYSVKMRPCYPYSEQVNFVMLPGTWNGQMFIPAPGDSDPAQNQSVVSRSFPTAQPYDLRVTAINDSKGRPLRMPFNRRIRVQVPQSAPSITQQPQALTVIDGQDASFSVAADGGGLSYRWQLNGVNLNDGGGLSGAHTDQLTLTNVSAAQAGDYRVRVSNSVGTVFSSTAHLTVQAPAPDIFVEQDWDGVEVSQGGTFVFPDPVPRLVSTSRLFKISNVGTEPLILTQAQLVSGQCFSQIEDPLTTLAAGESTTFRVRLHCASIGQFQGAVTIPSNDPDEDPYVFYLQGTVISEAADIAVAQNWDGTPIPNGGSFTFPDPTPVGVPTSRAFSITNEGSSDLILSNATQTVSGTCFHQIETPIATLAPGASTHVRVRLHCNQSGTFTGAVTFQSNDPDENSYTFSVTGTVSP